MIQNCLNCLTQTQIRQRRETLGCSRIPEARDREGSSRQHHLLEGRNRFWKEGGGDMGKEAGLGQKWQHTREPSSCVRQRQED